MDTRSGCWFERVHILNTGECVHVVYVFKTVPWSHHRRCDCDIDLRLATRGRVLTAQQSGLLAGYTGIHSEVRQVE